MQLHEACLQQAGLGLRAMWFVRGTFLQSSSDHVTLFTCSQILLFSFFFFCLLGPHPRHRELPRLGVYLELQLPAYATATATPDPSRICHLHHSSRQRWILNPLSESRDQTHVLMDTKWVPNPLNHNGNSLFTRLEHQFCLQKGPPPSSRGLS